MCINHSLLLMGFFINEKFLKIRAFLFNKPIPLSWWHLMTAGLLGEWGKKKKKKKQEKKESPWDASMFSYFINKHHGSRSCQGMQLKWRSVHCHFNCGERELWIAFIYKNLLDQRKDGITSVKDFWTPTCLLWNLNQKSPSYCFNNLQQGLISKTLEKVV